MFAEAGKVPADSKNARVMAGICEELWLIKATAEAGPPDITADSFMRAVDSLGDTFPSLFVERAGAVEPLRLAEACRALRLARDC